MHTVEIETLSRELEKWQDKNPRIIVPGNYATPEFLLTAVTDVVGRAQLFALNPQVPWPDRVDLTTETPFIGRGVRGEKSLKYLPMRLSLVPRLFQTTRQPDIVLLHTSRPMDGKVSLGIEVNVLPAAIEAVRATGGLVVAQINKHMPYTFGDSEIAVDDIDFAIEVDSPLKSPVQRPPDDESILIGQNVATLIPDGSTLQTGIGAIPDAVLGQLRNHRDLRVWSEMISDGILQLDQRGNLYVGEPIVTTFLFGSPELYEWVNRNPRVHMARTEIANDPAQIAKRPLMRSINSALQVDLYAQSNASYINQRIFSGFGGQPDFVSGALHSPGGEAILALHSWQKKIDTSNVVPLLNNPVCSFQHTAIVSEQGIASLFGRSQAVQARHIIDAVAHPNARESLEKTAGELGLF